VKTVSTYKLMAKPIESKVVIGADILYDEIQAIQDPLVFVIDARLLDDCSELKEGAPIEIEGGEHIKTREMKIWLEDELIKRGCAGDLILVGVGGGSLLDLVGFVAGTYCRGCRFISIPTTLLSMVDAAIGGKNGVNVGEAKNFIGTIFQPEKIIIDINFLKKLPLKEIQSGLAEMVKHAFISGYEAVEFTTSNLEGILEKKQKCLIESIVKNIDIKMQIVQDINEQRRDLLNLGHTVGHAIEVLEDFSMPHGQAVAIGIIAECRLAERLGILPPHVRERIENLVRAIGLPLFITKSFSQEQWIKALRFDKKSKAGKPRFVLLQDIGKPLVIDGKYCHEVKDSDIAYLFDLIHKEFLQDENKR
jgi:3-dehydroquinate synthase